MFIFKLCARYPAIVGIAFWVVVTIAILRLIGQSHH